MRAASRSFRRIRRILLATIVAAAALVVPAGTGGALVVLPEPEGPWGYTYGALTNGDLAPGCRFYRVAMGNGVAEELGVALTCADGLTFSPSGVLYGYTLEPFRGPGVESNLVTIDPATGAQTVVGSMGRGFFEGGMTFDPDGKLWLYSEPDDDSCPTGGSCLYAVDPATGATTAVGGPGEEGFVPTGLAADCTTVYATGALALGYPGDTLYTVDTTNGAVTSVGSTELPIHTEGLDFGADATLYTLGEPLLGGPTPFAPVVATLDPTTGVGDDEVEWISNDTTPNVVFGLAVGGLTCATPEPEPPVVEPTFTG